MKTACIMKVHALLLLVAAVVSAYASNVDGWERRMRQLYEAGKISSVRAV